MSELEKIKIVNLIYKIRDKQVIIDSEMSVTKFHKYFYYMMITHYDISVLISVFNNYVII